MNGRWRRIGRRCVTVPGLAVACVLCVALLPVSGLYWLLPPYRRPSRRAVPRLHTFALVYLGVEWWGLAAATVLWFRRPFGGDEDVERVYRLLRRLLRALVTVALPLFGLRVRMEPDGLSAMFQGGLTSARPPVEDADEASRPWLVLCRHAGPGDSFLLMYMLLLLSRRPRMVMRRGLCLDPCLDVLLNRVPSLFVDHSSQASRERSRRGLGDLAGSMGPRDALVIFPEGGNFTLSRRRRAISRLRQEGRPRLARRAQRLTHVLPPEPGGVLSALEACPRVEVQFVAHTGLDVVLGPGDLWSNVPLPEEVRVSWLRVSADDVPTRQQSQVEWLYTMWGMVDGWIDSVTTRS